MRQPLTRLNLGSYGHSWCVKREGDSCVSRGSAFMAVLLMTRGCCFENSGKPLGNHLEGQRDPLTAADAHRNDTFLEAVSTHRMEKSGC